MNAAPKYSITWICIEVRGFYGPDDFEVDADDRSVEGASCITLQIQAFPPPLEELFAFRNHCPD